MPAFHSFPSLIAGHNCIRVPEWIENHFSFYILTHDKRGHVSRCRVLCTTDSITHILYRKFMCNKKTFCACVKTQSLLKLLGWIFNIPECWFSIMCLCYLNIFCVKLMFNILTYIYILIFTLFTFTIFTF